RGGQYVDTCHEAGDGPTDVRSQPPTVCAGTVLVAVAFSACSPVAELARIPYVTNRPWQSPLALDTTSVYVGGPVVFAVPTRVGAPVLLGFPNLGSSLPNTLAVTVDNQFVYATS